MTNNERSLLWVKVLACYRRLIHQKSRGAMLNENSVEFMAYFDKSCRSAVYDQKPSDHRLKRLGESLKGVMG